MRSQYWRFLTSFTVALGFCLVASAQDGAPVVREKKSVTVDGADEEWQLVWNAQPKESSCGPHDVDTAITCPCRGFAYGEEGKLSLVRKRAGNEVQRLALGPLFGLEYAENPVAEHRGALAALQRWGDTSPEDAERALKDDPTLAADIMRRPASVIMKLADYDHDGRATEFLLHISNVPCGQEYDVAVGISKTATQLHAFASRAHPNEPLVLPRHAWQALLNGPGEHTVVQLECGDHGSEVHDELVLSAAAGEIRVRQTEYSCPFDAASPKLIRETEL